jgi:hypothetical protein
MAKKLDPLLIEILTKHGESVEAAVWDCHGTWVVYHKAIERIAAKAGVVFELPQIIEANSAAKTVAIAVKGTMGERSEWSFGEASPGNNKNSYPYAMAEKRAKDRVVLKLVGLHGLAYSEEESDDFKPQSEAPAAHKKPLSAAAEATIAYAMSVADPLPVAPPPVDETYAPPPRKANGLPEVGWREDGSRTSFWLKNDPTAAEVRKQLQEDAADCHTILALDRLKRFYRGKASELKWNRQFKDVLAEDFGQIEQRILASLDNAQLAEMPLKETLQKSLRATPDEEAAALDRARTLGNSLVQNYTSG